jgi:putative aminopeptidase FrvX
MVRRIADDGNLELTRLGGTYPWKLGEGPVDILSSSGFIPGVLGFGGIHTEDKAAASVQARDQAVGWEHVRVFTGLSAGELRSRGVRPGTRVVVHRSRRQLTRLNDHISGHFLDDRADLVSLLLMLQKLMGRELPVWFVASAAEEVGGEGALYLLQAVRPDICLALELGANVPDARVELTSAPTVWAIDGYAATSAQDLEILASLRGDLQFQAFSRGGSDASCAASKGLCARPVTLGLPMENSHGYEIMHVDAMEQLATLGCAYLEAVLNEPS